MTFPAAVSGTKLCKRANSFASFADHFSQAGLFFRSQSVVEQRHIVAAFQFELAKCRRVEIRERVVGNWAKVDASLAKDVGSVLDTAPPAVTVMTADGASSSPLLSLLARPGRTGINGNEQRHSGG